jgi:N-methylhydantoinase A
VREPTTVVGVDVGGTFTDFFSFDESGKGFATAKVPSHRGDEARGFLEGLGTAREISALASIVHGTTVGTNALLERKGARIGLITTRGFRDVRDAPARPAQHLGSVGRFRPGRGSRPQARGR